MNNNNNNDDDDNDDNARNEGVYEFIIPG